MPRYAKAIVGIVLGLILIMAACVAALALMDWNMARPWLGRQISELTHRPVSLDGDLSVQWLSPQTEPAGKAGWLPWPQITARDIQIGNPAWSTSSPDMGKVGKLAVTLNLAALLTRTVQIPSLELQDADIVLEREESGANNWSLTEKPAENSPPPAWNLDLRRLVLHNVDIRFRNPGAKLDAKVNLNTLDETTEQGYGIGWKASGTYNKAEISGRGQAGSILSLQENGQGRPYPVQASVKVGATTIDVEGSITRPTNLAALDLTLKLKGASMADLNPLSGLALPDTPAYATQGRLTGLLKRGQSQWRYENFKGRVGASDLEGSVEYLMRKPRPLLKGTLRSKLLRLKDLGPLIGLGKSAGKQPPDKVLPASPINTASWDRMDADIRFSGDKIVQSEQLPLENVKADVKLDDKILTLTPLDFGVAGGTLASTIMLDGKGSDIQAKLNVSARHLKLRKLLPGAESMHASLGELHGDAALTGHGKSFAQLLGTSNGQVSAVIGKGTVSHLLLETAGLNLANIVLVKLFGDEQVKLNCMVSDFGVKNGLMQARVFKLDTEDATVDITGTINLASEKLDLDIKPENKTLRIFTLRTPLYVHGTFKKPDVGVHAGPIAARAGAAVALGVVAAPLAALVPLLNLGTNEGNGCGELLKKDNAKTKGASIK